MWTWLSRVLHQHVVQDTPPELAFCESACPYSACSAERFATCPLRRDMAAIPQPSPVVVTMPGLYPNEGQPVLR